MCQPKISNSLKARKLKKRLEELGHTNINIWYEPVRRGCEMGGYEGGWFFTSSTVTENTEDNYFDVLGYNIEEALEAVENYDIREE